MRNDELPIKIVMAGPGSVGKSALTLFFMYEEIVEDYEPTKADSYRKAIVLDGEQVCIDILDTAGQEEYVSVSENYFRTCEGALLVFDASVFETLEKLSDYWDSMCRVKDPAKPIAVVVANKIDKKEFIDPKTLAMGREFAQERNLPFIETSATTNVNVEAAFYLIAREIRRHQSATVQSLKPARKKTFRRRCTIL